MVEEGGTLGHKNIGLEGVYLLLREVGSELYYIYNKEIAYSFENKPYYYLFLLAFFILTV